MKHAGLAITAIVLAIGISCSKRTGITAGPGFQKSLQEALINAKP